MATPSAAAPSGTTSKNPVQQFLDLALFVSLAGGLTPLQTSKLEAAVQAHENSGLVDSVALQHQRADVDKHWSSLTSTFEKRAYSHSALHLFGHDFATLLVEEYFEEQFKHEPPLNQKFIAPFIQMFGSESQKEAALKVLVGGDESLWPDLYDRTIGRAIKEYMLDREHIESRLRAVANREKPTKTFIEASDDVQLLRLIQNDLSALKQIVSYLPDLDELEPLISAQAQVFLLKVRPQKVALSSKAQPLSFFTKLNDYLGNGPTQQPSISLQSLSNVRALLSKADLHKKTI